MAELHDTLASRVADWRSSGYAHDEFPAIAEILQFAIEGELEGQPFPQSGTLRYLRPPQLRALETYSYLRLVERTPHVTQLYRDLFPSVPDRLDALGLSGEVFLRIALDGGVDGLLERIRVDDDFVRANSLEALRETFALDYPSYILALAMGAGKTLLIGAIIATEFALALEYPDAGEGDEDDTVTFIENALIFAPGKTILEALRQLTEVEYPKLLPPRLYKPFEASLKVTFTQDGERDIAVVRGSSFNLIVTNTEKIRIQARSGSRAKKTLRLATADEEAREEANLRLQTIASLPHLGIFSDEAHHTYGQALGVDLKRVRQTVDYLHDHTNVVAVVNTTGTPYYRRQPIKDVVFWYGLAQGISDGILKEVANNIYAFDFEASAADEFVSHVVTDFFEGYGDAALADGSPAKLAIYFPQTDDLDELEPAVQLALTRAGHSPSIILRNTSRSSDAEIDAFNRLNDPGSPYRVILLVNKGTEGWNCPSLFATALARKLRTSNNFVLQAATRCLRQVPSNDRPARIYLSRTNERVLDRQLQETYGESLSDLDRRHRASRSDFIRLRKAQVAPLILNRSRRELERKESSLDELKFESPSRNGDEPLLRRAVFDIGLSAASRRVLRQVGDVLDLAVEDDATDHYTAACELGSNYRFDRWAILDALRDAYESSAIPISHLPALAAQLERQLGSYEEIAREEKVSLAIVKPDGFEEIEIDGVVHRQASISYPADKAHLIWPVDRVSENPAELGFHYTPYNFDSGPEADFFERMLRELNMSPEFVQDIYFTGGITDPKKTDIWFTYERDGRSRRYTPDFVIHTTDDRWLLVEVKMTARRDDPVEGREGLKAKALRNLEERNPERVGYQMVFADDLVSPADITRAREFVEDAQGKNGPRKSGPRERASTKRASTKKASTKKGSG